MNKKVLLMILDGYGIGDISPYNAVKNANTPNIDSLFNKYMNSSLVCSGKEVGLPEGTMGNSEVGHLNIGAGRVIYQDISKIDNSIADESFFKNKTILDTFNYAKKNGKKVHLLGLISDGGVHSSLDHLKALIKMADANDLKDVFIHAFMDGRDTPPNSGITFIDQMELFLDKQGIGKIASVSGRFYAMDRDNRWQRVQKAYDAMVNGLGNNGNSAKDIIEKSYKNNVNDEFILPSLVMNDKNKPVALIEQGDVVIFFNFRSDRAREISIALNDSNFSEFETKKLGLNYITMTRYREDFPYKIISKKEHFKNILGEVISNNGLNQLRTAETEKFAHVTFFFNGGEDKVFLNEERLLVNSPKVETYDLQPEMSAYMVRDNVINALETQKYELIIVNFANSDMVGHTGIYDAAIKALEAVDKCVGDIYKTTQEQNYTLILTADHGNSEKMQENGIPFTAHTKNKVPFLITDENIERINDGKLADIAPTILKLMGIECPKEMTGDILI